MVINVQENPHVYNKEFLPDDNECVVYWIEDMRPTHISEGEWQLAVGELILMMERVKESKRENLFLGWKSKHGLLPQE